MTVYIKLYELLKTKFGEKDAEVFLEYIDAKTERSVKEETKTFATREDIAKLEASITYRMIAILLAQTGLIIALLKVF